MRPTRKYLLPLLLTAALLAGCGVAPADGQVELLWPERQSIFRLDAARTRLEVFSIRGGITPLGAVPLPATLCPGAMALDAAENRLWLWSAQGGVVIDARSLKVVRQWQSETNPKTAVPGRVSMVALQLPFRPDCHSSAKTLHAMGKTPMKD